MDHFVQTEIVKFSDREASRGGFPSEVQITAWPARSDPTSLMLDFSMRVRSLESQPEAQRRPLENRAGTEHACVG